MKNPFKKSRPALLSDIHSMLPFPFLPIKYHYSYLQWIDWPQPTGQFAHMSTKRRPAARQKFGLDTPQLRTDLCYALSSPLHVCFPVTQTADQKGCDLRPVTDPSPTNGL